MSERFDVQHRDVFESLAACAAMGGADLVLTSPPYPDARSDAQYGGASFDTSVDGYHQLGLAVFEALKPGGVCVLNIDGPCRKWRDGFESERSLISLEVGLDWAKAVGFRYLDHVAYARDGFPTSTGPRWRSGWEPVHVFAKPGAAPHFDPWAYTRKAVTAGAYTTKPGAGCRDVKGIRRQPGRSVKGDRRRLMSCERWNASATTDSDHPAPFSSDFSDAMVLCYCPEDGLVCDPFVGSGTVALSCHRHGRRFIGGDMGHRERDGRPWVDIVLEQLSQGRCSSRSPGHRSTARRAHQRPRPCCSTTRPP